MYLNITQKHNKNGERPCSKNYQAMILWGGKKTKFRGRNYCGIINCPCKTLTGGRKVDRLISHDCKAERKDPEK